MPKVTSGIRLTTEEKREKERLRKQKARSHEQVQPLEGDAPETKFTKTFFIAIDGEGQDDKSRNYPWVDGNNRERVSEYQKYVIMRASTGEELKNEGLSDLRTPQILSWLCNLALKYPRAVFIGFGLGYDVTMWLRDLTFQELKDIRTYAETNDEVKREKGLHAFETDVYPVNDIPHSTHAAFKIEHFPRKEFKCTRVEYEKLENYTDVYKPKMKVYLERANKGEKPREKRKVVTHGHIQIFDVIGFFQCSFVKALEEYGLLKQIQNADFLQNMKNSRGQFDTLPIETISEYCLLECVQLVKLMELLESYLHHPQITLKLSRWDGAGAIASALHKQHGTKHHLGDMPQEVVYAALYAYSGGRIETIRYGHIEGQSFESVEEVKQELTKRIEKEETRNKRKRKNKKTSRTKEEIATEVDYLLETRWKLLDGKYVEMVVWDYDINSAYPTSMCNLPSLLGDDWRLEREIKTNFALCHVRWDLTPDRNNPQRIFPFFYRTQSSTIIYPTCGEGWYWLPEYQAAMEHLSLYNGSIELLEVWNFYEQDSTIRPFDFIQELAKQRLIWKKLFQESEGTDGGQNVVIKLGLNSLYGKLAQQIGGYWNEKEQKMQLPPYHNIALAGFVTSDTRAKMYKAAMINPDQVVMFATDGLFTTSPIPSLPISKNLGEWDVKTVRACTIVQSGVYYYDSGKKDSKGVADLTIKSRGFEKGSITEEMVLAQWRKGRDQECSTTKDGTVETKFEVKGTTRMFVTFGMLCTAQEEKVIERNMHRLASWETRERYLKLSPSGTKRMSDMDVWPNTTDNCPADKLIPTVPLRNSDYEDYSHISKQYDYEWLKAYKDLTEEQKQYMIEVEEKNEYESQNS